MDVFNELVKVIVNDNVEIKDTGKVKLSYLSWTYAWKEIKSRYPDASYEIIRQENGLPYTYDPNTGYMVFTRVTIEGITHEMWLPVMDSHNDAMLAQPYEVKTRYGSYWVQKCTMFDINKTIMRCLVKNFAMFGLGLYIYAGEDLPLDADDLPKMKGGSATAEEKAELTSLFSATLQSGAKVFTDEEIRKFSAMRTEKTAGELIELVKAELRKRCANE